MGRKKKTIRIRFLIEYNFMRIGPDLTNHWVNTWGMSLSVDSCVHSQKIQDKGWTHMGFFMPILKLVRCLLSELR